MEETACGGFNWKDRTQMSIFSDCTRGFLYLIRSFAAIR